MIYFDNAATTLQKPDPVIQAAVCAIRSLGNAGRGVHEATLAASRILYETREKLAAFFHAESASRIAFTSNSTEALNIAIKGTLKEGDHVITTQLEHNSVLRPLYEMEERGVQLSIVPCDASGRIDPAELARSIRKNTKAVFCTHGSNVTGNLVDIAAIGKISRENGLLFGVDASQTAGTIPIDVQNMNIDILCFTGHKGMLGLQGTGGIYVRDGVSVRPLKTGGSGVQSYEHRHPAQMPEALEAGTPNGPGIAGLNAAVTYLLETGIDVIHTRELALMHRFYNGIRAIPGITVYGDFSADDRCPIVSLNVSGYDSSEVSDELSCTYQIATRPGAHCAPLMHEALGTVSRGAVRFSFSHYNTEKEVDFAISAMREIAQES